MLEGWLVSQNIPCIISYNETNTKANLFATVPARTNTLRGGLVLSGHTDVVPVDGQAWDTDPFSTITTEGKIYGRGTCDMKGFIAVVLALIPAFKKMHLTKPLHFAFSYDEEVGCLGAPFMIEDFQKKGFHPAACIVGEPTECRPVVASKGIHGYRCRLHGFAAHSSLTPKGCNAVEHAAELICWIRNLANQLKQQGPKDKYFDVPFTTITSNVIMGGTALNIIPALSEFLFEFRNLPDVNPESIISQIKSFIDNDLLPKMRNEYEDAVVEIESMGAVPAFQAKDYAVITQLAREVSENPVIHKVSYATEAGIFENAGIQTIICGPGSIEQAHKPNEFVSVEQLDKYQEFLQRVVKRFLSTSAW